ncbi:MAG: hypothetical protein IT567_06945 [Alphaproteobacteria bacterium]|nr:hypothetical protein [Alphaproteobacteria bacterium]
MALPIDRSRLQRVTGGDAALETEMFQFYRETAERCMETMESYCVSGGDMWASGVRELGSASTNLGAVEMKELCARAGSLQTQEERAKLLEDLQRAYTRLLPFFNSVPGSSS